MINGGEIKMSAVLVDSVAISGGYVDVYEIENHVFRLKWSDGENTKWWNRNGKIREYPSANIAIMAIKNDITKKKVK
jgi:hypothetical protein